jgi:hypothetical protein
MTFVAALRRDGLMAPVRIRRPDQRRSFLAYDPLPGAHAEVGRCRRHR